MTEGRRRKEMREKATNDEPFEKQGTISPQLSAASAPGGEEPFGSSYLELPSSGKDKSLAIFPWKVAQVRTFPFSRYLHTRIRTLIFVASDGNSMRTGGNALTLGMDTDRPRDEPTHHFTVLSFRSGTIPGSLLFTAHIGKNRATYEGRNCSNFAFDES